jgi:hypothetical protein
MNSCSTGSVTGEFSVGGLVGSNMGFAHIINCYATGDVTGNRNVAGIAGHNSCREGQLGTIQCCYSVGGVTGTEYVGSIVGWNCGAVVSSFWDIQTSGMDEPDRGEGRTTAQMQMQSTFTAAGWDFVGETENGTEDIWWIVEGRDYPRLAWEPWAFYPHPEDGAVDVVRPVILNWVAGASALQHDIYFGEDAEAVSNATMDSPGIYRGRQAAEMTSYEPGDLGLAKTYYWRIDRVKEGDPQSPWKGNVWSFTTANFIVVDDFEGYDDYCNRIYYIWLDGWGYLGDTTCGVDPCGGNTTGSCVGCLGWPEWPVAHSAEQSMPFDYNNTGKDGKFLYSETERTWDAPQDWTREGVKALALWFIGRPPSVGSFSYEPLTGIYTMTANGSGIFGISDEFHYAFKRLSGVGTIEARVLSITEADTWSKGGVMIRETLHPHSAFAAVYITCSQGCRFQTRPANGAGAIGDSSFTQLAHIRAPHWIKLERVIGGGFNAYDSNDPAVEGWHPLAWNPQTVDMTTDVYIGLALTSHNTDPTVVCAAEFSDVTMTGTITGQWQSQDIGIDNNAAEQLYVVLEDSTGESKVVNHPDPNAVVSDTWQEWNIDLKEVGDAGVNLEAVKKMYIGVGDRDDPEFGGSGRVFFDDIRLYRPRCMPPLLKPDADFNGNCVVDYPDLEIMANEWLADSNDLQADLDLDNDVDFKDYTMLADTWLDALLWP